MRLAIALVSIAACGVPEAGDVEVRWLDAEQFATEVQPVLGERCGNPSCHGTPDRPFSIYSTQQWRADPERLYLPEPITAEELDHNYTASCVFASDAVAPADTLLVRKPLADLADTYHGGGVVFEGTADRDYRAVLGWIEGGWR